MAEENTSQSPQEAPAPAESAAPKPRRKHWSLWILGALAVLVILFVFFVFSVELLHYTETAAFCSSCHVMHPENTAYENSPHARAECGTCHIGPGALAAFQAKMANVRYLWVYPTGRYERPIPSPIHSLRPVEVVCEQCHWPEKFFANRLVNLYRHAEDEQNSLTKIALLMQTGGGTAEAGLGRGIHWHIENPVYYIATDEQFQDIPWVQAEYNGEVIEYLSTTSTLTQADIDRAEKRKMDCVDCHNRASHDFRRPSDSIDEAMAVGLIAADLPFIKQQGVDVLERAYETEEEAAAAISGIANFYQQNHPDVYNSRQADVEQAVAQLQSIFDRTTFPFMNVTWQSHRNNIGHRDFPGCFRCHDGQHLSKDNQAIRLECNICHAIPQVALPGQPFPIVNAWPRAIEPESHLTTTWLSEHRFRFDATCTECHTVGDPGGTSNTSFCSNSACHGTEWVYAGLNAPAIRELAAPPREPGSGQPNPVPHPITPDTNCMTCHGVNGVIPAPDSHASFDVATCTQCHQGPQSAGAAPTDATPAPQTGGSPEASPTAQPSEEPAGGSPPAIPHTLEGREGCVLCHGENGVKPFPADHTGRTNDVCQMCHKPAPAGSETPAAGSTPAPTAAPPSGEASRIPHDIEGQENQCLACHFSTSIEPFPANHEGFSNQMCLSCHTLED